MSERADDPSATGSGDLGLPPRDWGRRAFGYLVLFLGAVVLANALVGESGISETVRARREEAALARSLAQLRAENARLQERVRRLSDDPKTIEEIARRDLGWIKRGEILIRIKDLPPPSPESDNPQAPKPVR